MRQPSEPAEWSRFYRLSGVDGVELLHACFVRHRFARHTHDHLVIGLVESGVQSYTYRGAAHQTPAGHVFLVNPGEAHTGEAATADGYVYRTLYASDAFLLRIARESGRSAGMPTFPEAVLDDAELTAELARFHRAIAASASALVCESLLTAALMGLFGRHAAPRFTTPAPRREMAAVRRAREYLEAHFAENVSLSRLGEIVSLSPWYFARTFERAVGLPPHAYQEVVRARRARELLERGAPVVEVALAVGYPDQPHFTRRFKRLLGITPGQYVREGRIAQDRFQPATHSRRHESQSTADPRSPRRPGVGSVVRANPR
jgi:AraC-like DNA-binding protein